MSFQSPITGLEWATHGSDGTEVRGDPRQSSKDEKYFERNGYEIVETTHKELSQISNDRTDQVAFKLTKSGVLRGSVRSSHRMGVFTADGVRTQLGEHFHGGGDLIRLEDDAEGSEVRGLNIDASRDGIGVKALNTEVGCEMRNVTVRGEMDSNQQWGSGIYCTVPRGQKVVLKNVNQPQGASRNYGKGSTEDSIGVLLNGTSDGVLELHNCTFGGFPNNGVYVEPYKKHNDGYAKIYNHTGYNSDRDQIRVGGRSKVINPTIYVSKKKPGFNNLRGVWFKAAQGATLKGGSIKTFKGRDPGSAIRIEETSGAVDIIDVDVELRGKSSLPRGVRAHEPIHNRPSDIVIEDCQFHGDANPKQVILSQGGRDVDLRNVDIDVSAQSKQVDVRD